MRVELDGELADAGGRTDDDTWRDNEAVVGTEEITLRYRWSHVVGDDLRDRCPGRPGRDRPWLDGTADAVRADVPRHAGDGGCWPAQGPRRSDA